MSKLTNRALYSRLLKVADQNDIKVMEIDGVPNDSWGMFVRNNKGLKAILLSNQLDGLLQKIYALAYLMGCSVLPFGTGSDISEIAEAVVLRDQLLNYAHIPGVFKSKQKLANRLESCIIHNDSTPEAISNFIFQNKTEVLFDGLLEVANKNGIYIEDFEQCKHPGINGVFATKRHNDSEHTKVIILSDALGLGKKAEVLAYLVGCSVFTVQKPVNMLRPAHMRGEGAEERVTVNARGFARNLLNSLQNNENEDVFNIEPFIAAEQLQSSLGLTETM